jgi:hypothetical protein
MYLWRRLVLDVVDLPSQRVQAAPNYTVNQDLIWHLQVVV